MILSATGHRPDKLIGYGVGTHEMVCAFALIMLTLLKPNKVVSGMAQGWDQGVAHAAVLLEIPLTAAVPFEGFNDRWPEEAQKLHEMLLSKAAKVHYVCDAGYAVWKLQKRNEWMADHSHRALALHDGSTGGTCNFIKYAEKQGLPVVNVWNIFEIWRDRLGVKN